MKRAVRLQKAEVSFDEDGCEPPTASVPVVGPDMPLPLLPPGRQARVCRILPAGEGMARKLSAMGLLPGVVLTVLNSQGGALLLRLGDTRIAIGRGMAQRVMVAPCDG